MVMVRVRVRLDGKVTLGAALLELHTPALVGGLEELQWQRVRVVPREGPVGAEVAAEA